MSKIKKTIKHLEMRKEKYEIQLVNITDENMLEDILFEIKIINEKIIDLERALDIIFEEDWITD
jgi:predicted  nucleic acid-binding Zn-ribbon protein